MTIYLIILYSYVTTAIHTQVICTVNYCDVHYSVTTSIPVSVDQMVPTDSIRNSISTPCGHVQESHISQVKQTGEYLYKQESLYISPGLSIQSLFTYICVLSLYL